MTAPADAERLAAIDAALLALGSADMLVQSDTYSGIAFSVPCNACGALPGHSCFSKQDGSVRLAEGHGSRRYDQRRYQRRAVLLRLLDEREAEVARLREPSGAAMEVAREVIKTIAKDKGMGVDFVKYASGPQAKLSSRGYDTEQEITIALQPLAAALDHAAQSSREAALTQCAELLEERAAQYATRQRSAIYAGFLVAEELNADAAAIRALITKGGA